MRFCDVDRFCHKRSALPFPSYNFGGGNGRARRPAMHLRVVQISGAIWVVVRNTVLNTVLVVR
jgi:hypothetical protein